ncbi:MAG: hypothetical protein U1E01_20490, partial [Methylicorpusculum sp.]|nr:hypothetical protein [Methylicorpusculum sp.]
NRAKAAALQAISSPLLENMSVEGAHGVLFNITGGKNLSLYEVGQAASVMYEQAHEEANIILGSVIDEAMGDEVSVTIIATGFYQSRSGEKVSAIQSVSGEKKEGQVWHEQNAQVEPIVFSECAVAPVYNSVSEVSVPEKYVSQVCVSHLGACEKTEGECSTPEASAYEALAQGPLAQLQRLAQTEEVVASKVFDTSSQQNMPEAEIIQAAQVVSAISEKNTPVAENMPQKLSSGATQVHQEGQQEYEVAGIDMDDLDVPTFLRKEKQQGAGE